MFNLDDFLSNAERVVAEHVSQGLTNKQVGEILFVSEKTIKVHLTSIYKKMNVKSRAELIVKVRNILSGGNDDLEAVDALSVRYHRLLSQAQALDIKIRNALNALNDIDKNLNEIHGDLHFIKTGLRKDIGGLSPGRSGALS